MQKYQNVVVNQRNELVRGAAVTVYLAGTTTLATLYSDNGITQTSNPVTADSLATFSFYAADGRYDLRISAGGAILGTITDILLEDPVDGVPGGSAVIVYTPAGTGAVPTTVQAKLRETFSATDHTTTLQNQTAAIAAIPSKFWSDETPRPNIHRIPNRVLMGNGVASSGASSQTANESWLYQNFGAYWLERGAQLFVLPDANGYIGQVSAARTSTADASAGVAIGGASIGWNDKTSGGTLLTWAHYFEAVIENGAGATYGAEVAVKNKGPDHIRNPYAKDSSGGMGWWFAGGGDATYGGSPANPSNTAVAIGKNAHTWNVGICFDADGITGTDGVTGTGSAVRLAKGHRLDWFCDSTNLGAQIYSTISAGAGKTKALQFADNNVFLGPTTAASLFNFDMASTAVNGFQFSGTASGVGRSVLSATGTDTNLDIDFGPKGTGLLRIGNYTAGAPAATGYMLVKDRSGTTFKLLTAT